MTIKNIYEDKVIAYKYINQLYINKLISISIADCINLSKIFPVFFINYNGTILGSIKLENEEV
jgi:hypothetical protein